MKRRSFIASLGGLALAQSYAPVADASASAESGWQTLRRQFLLAEDYTYLNTGGLGASPGVVRQIVRERMDPEDSDPAAAHNMTDWWRIKEKCARQLGPGCRKEDLALTSTTTEGINIILNGLPLTAGDEVITSTHEHVALATPLLNILQRKGIIIRAFAPDLENGPNNVERIERLIGRRTRLIFISHVTCTTGQIFPVPEIGALARARGLWFALDGAQALGALPLDVKEIGVDCYAASGHKWLRGPRRTGLLYVREGMLETLRPRWIFARPSVRKGSSGTTSSLRRALLRACGRYRERRSSHPGRNGSDPRWLRSG